MTCAHAACSMAEEFPQLMPDISELEWANEAFGAPPEATNLWIGGDESVTSFHKASSSPFTTPVFCMLMASVQWP